jgi:hypothetical protein
MAYFYSELLLEALILMTPVMTPCTKAWTIAVPLLSQDNTTQANAGIYTSI